MKPRYTAPMPSELRHQLRTGHHPSRSVPCPHCGARAHQPCRLRKSRRTIPEHPQRMNAWALTVARCPECQVEPTVPCRTVDGFPLPDVHDRRHQEAEATCA